jgi:hypothetical protein
VSCPREQLGTPTPWACAEGFNSTDSRARRCKQQGVWSARSSVEAAGEALDLSGYVATMYCNTNAYKTHEYSTDSGFEFIT